MDRLHIPLWLARAIRPEAAVGLFCYLLPDLVDKPLFWVFGISCGRYVGHTLLFLLLITIAFSLWKRKYGLFALCGVALHFALDVGWFMPWFYPFVKYNFPHIQRSDSFNLQQIGEGFLELVLIVLAVLAISIVLSLIGDRCSRKRAGRRHPDE
jgi:hypothetical protein